MAIIALKGLLEHIVVKKKINDFYSSITQEKIDKIHAKGNLLLYKSFKYGNLLIYMLKEVNQFSLKVDANILIINVMNV